MGMPKTDSPIARRIALAFLDFLNSVEPASELDREGLDVLKECLCEVFKLGSTINDAGIEPGVLIKLFQSLEKSGEGHSEQRHEDNPVDTRKPLDSGIHSISDAHVSVPSKLQQDKGQDIEDRSSEFLKDELFGHLISVLEKVHFLEMLPDGRDDPVQLALATDIFQDALNEIQRLGLEYNKCSLAEAMKSIGNRAMQSKSFSNAIKFYSCAILLHENNAVYYCNRAAAYTQIAKYSDAISDALKSIEIDPNYSKAYSRLGLAYYGQGNYKDAIEKGFKKALQLDPCNESIKENLRVAEQKLREQHQQTEHEEEPSTSREGRGEQAHDQMGGGTRGAEVPPMFTSMPFAPNGIPVDFSTIFSNFQRQAADANAGRASEEPQVHMGGNINLSFGDNMPEAVGGALRSMMQMFGGSVPGTGTGDSVNERHQHQP